MRAPMTCTAGDASSVIRMRERAARCCWRSGRSALHHGPNMLSRFAFFVMLVGGASLAAACSSPAAPPAELGGTGAHSASDASTPDATPPASPSDDPLINPSYPLAVVVVDNGSSTGLSAIAASADPVGPCTVTRIGICVVRSCAASIPTYPATFPSLGVITLSAGGGSLSASPQSDGSYARQQSAAALYAAGDTLRVEATGAQIPGFAISLVAGDTLALEAMPSSFDRTQPMVIQWSGDTNGFVRFEFGAESDWPLGSGVTCGAKAADRQITISPDVLGRLSAGQTSLGVSYQSEATAHAGAFTVVVAAKGEVGLPPGVNEYPIPITLR
jgi:hypothetical protein